MGRQVLMKEKKSINLGVLFSVASKAFKVSTRTLGLWTGYFLKYVRNFYPGLALVESTVLQLSA